MTTSILLSEPKKLIEAIVLCLNELISQSQAIQGIPSIFDLKNKPTIAFPNYLMRIVSFMGCSVSAYIYSLILIDKIQEENPGFKLTSKNVHRLLFTSIVVATKFIDDKYYKNKYYASVGGIGLNTLNQQEQQMLNMLNYHCPSNSDLFKSYLQKLEGFVISKMNDEQSNIQQKLSPTTTVEEEQPRQKRRQLREKRQRSREKYSQHNYQTQQSRQIEPY